MATENRYTPPRAAVADVQDANETFQEVKIWSAKGRIGRLRYLAYSMAASLILGVFAAVVMAALGPFGAVLVLLAYIPLLVFSIFCMIQRAHDMGWSGWMCFLVLIPFAAFIWLFKAGTPGENDYGAPPPPNTTGIKILGWIAPVVALVGILAAIALPAYKTYVDRAKAAQHSQQ